MLVELEPNTLRNSRRHFLKWIPTAYKIDLGNSCKMTLRGIRKHERSRPFPFFIAELNYGRISRHLHRHCVASGMAGNVVLMHSRAKQNLYGTQQVYTHGFLSLHVPSLFVHVSVFEHVWGKKQQKNNKINVTEKALLLSYSSHR